MQPFKQIYTDEIVTQNMPHTSLSITDIALCLSKTNMRFYVVFFFVFFIRQVAALSHPAVMPVRVQGTEFNFSILPPEKL